MIWWNKAISVSDIQPITAGNMGEHLSIKFLEIGDDYITASMPVDHRTKQPYGLLHGGASCVLAETLGSVASALIVNPEKSICVGLEINANHVRSARKGHVIGKASAIHIGGSTHVWEIRISDESNKLICISRLTVAVLPKRKEAPDPS